MWHDNSTNRVKIVKHARFDEGMNDLPFNEIPPNVQHLTRVRQGHALEEESEEASINEFEFVTNPFPYTFSKKGHVCDRDSTFGFEFGIEQSIRI